jgi:hypothetical protein
MSKSALLAALILVAGCATNDDIAARQHAEDHRECIKHGFKPVTDGYARCRMAADEKRRIGRDVLTQQAQQDRATPAPVLRAPMPTNGQPGREGGVNDAPR